MRRLPNLTVIGHIDRPGGLGHVGKAPEIVAHILAALAVCKLAAIGKVGVPWPSVREDLPDTFTADHSAVFADHLRDPPFNLEERRTFPFIVIEPNAQLHAVLVPGVGLSKEKKIR